MFFFVGFLSRPNKLAGVTGFANVAKTEIWPEFCNVLVVCRCCRVMDYHVIIVLYDFFDVIWY
jgi:hypothetical protein